MPKSIDSADMSSLRYSIGTSGDRRHLHRDIHCAHKGSFGGLDLHRQLQARKASASTGPPIGAMLCRIPGVKPALTRSKSAACFIPSLLTLGKRKSTPPESIRAAVEAGSKAHESPPKPRKTVSFADLGEASRRSSRASSVASSVADDDEYDTDDDEEQNEAQPLFDEQYTSPAAPAAPPVHADEWASWAFQPADAAAFGMEQQMMLVPVMGPHGPQMVYMDHTQMAAMMYQQQMEYENQQHMAAVEQQQMAEQMAVHGYADPSLFAPVPMMPQMAPQQMGWAMPQQMPQQMPPQMQQMPPQMAGWQQQQMPPQMPPPHAYGNSPPHAASQMPPQMPPQMP